MGWPNPKSWLEKVSGGGRGKPFEKGEFVGGYGRNFQGSHHGRNSRLAESLRQHLPARPLCVIEAPDNPDGSMGQKHHLSRRIRCHFFMRQKNCKELPSPMQNCANRIVELRRGLDARSTASNLFLGNSGSRGSAGLPHLRCGLRHPKQKQGHTCFCKKCSLMFRKNSAAAFFSVLNAECFSVSNNSFDREGPSKRSVFLINGNCERLQNKRSFRF